MTDVTTNQPLRVSSDPTVGPYLELPVIQLDDVQRLLDSRGIAYCVDENYLSFDGGPEMATIDLGRGGDAIVVQAILDSVR